MRPRNICDPTSSNPRNSGMLHVNFFFKPLYHSYIRALATHKTILESVTQGALELCLWQIRKCNFLSDPCVFGWIF